MFHKIQIIGYLGQEPKMQYLPNGTAITNFSVAVNDSYKSGDNWEKKTIWYRVAIFGNKAETAHRYLKKGQAVMVEGKLKTNDDGSIPMWTDKNGNTRATLEITAYEFTFVGGQGNNQEVQSSNQSTTSAPSSNAVEEDDMPF